MQDQRWRARRWWLNTHQTHLVLQLLQLKIWMRIDMRMMTWKTLTLLGLLLFLAGFAASVDLTVIDLDRVVNHDVGRAQGVNLADVTVVALNHVSKSSQVYQSRNTSKVLKQDSSWLEEHILALICFKVQKLGQRVLPDLRSAELAGLVTSERLKRSRLSTLLNCLKPTFVIGTRRWDEDKKAV